MLTAIKSLGLGTRIILVTLVILIVVVLVNYSIFVPGYRRSAKQALVKKAAAFTAVADEIKNHVSNLNRDKVFASRELLDEMLTILKAGKHYDQARLFGTIPVVAGWIAAQQAANKENIDFKIVAFDARNKKNEPEKGSFREALLHDLVNQVNANPNDPSAEVAYRTDPNTNQLHYMRAVRVDESCLMCHGDPATSPTADGKDLLGFTMENWKVGKMHGAYEVVMPLGPVDAQVAGFVGYGAMWTTLLCAVAVAVFIFLLRMMFTKPLAALMGQIERLARGDLTTRFQVKSRDEIGKLAGWLNQFAQSLHDAISEVNAVARDTAAASTQIAASSEQMVRNMTEQGQQVMQISAAVSQMSSSVTEVAQNAQQASTSALESRQAAQDGGKVVSQTVQDIRAISHAVAASASCVQELGKRGEKIGLIIEVINDIADQTNLLALNAAIEAARAGEHGRGFAVVADEVRKLADRTTSATDEIAESIKAIQIETSRAVSQIDEGTKQVHGGVERATQAGQSLEQIVGSTQKVASMVQSIAAAAEEQAGASEEISKSVATIAGVSKQVNEGARQTAQAISTLAERSTEVQTLINKFKISGSDQPPNNSGAAAA